MTIRNTVMFREGGYLWSEAYWNLTGSAIGQAPSIAASQALAEARSNLMGAGCTIVAVRQSRDDVKRQTWDVFNSDDLKSNKPWTCATSTKLVVNDSGNADSPLLALKARYDFPDTGFAIKSMSGFPDSDFTGPRNFDFGGFFSSNANISGYWDAWVTLMKSADWGIRRRDASLIAARVQVTNVSFVTGSNFVKVEYVSPLSVNINDYVQLRGVVGDRPFSRINAIYKVGALVTGGLILKPAKRAPAGWTYVGSGTIEKVGYNYTTISTVRPMYVSGHKRGDRGFQEPKGKSKART